MVDALVVVRLSSAVLHFLPVLAAILFLGLTQSGCVSTPARLTLDDVYRPDPKNPRATINATPDPNQGNVRNPASRVRLIDARPSPR